MDIPDAPMLVDINVNGQTVKAVAQPTKQAWLYVFNRQTGQPIWPFEERPVEKGNVPGEWYSPTQPFPTKPPAYDLHGFVEEDIIDFTPELRAEGLKIASRYKLGPVFTPPVVSKWEGPLATLALAANAGGTNWAGGSYDPETHMAYIPSQRSLGQLGLVPGDPNRSGDFAYIAGQARNPNAPAGRARYVRHAFRQSGRHAARIRQGNRQRRWRGVYACGRNGYGDDLHGERQTIYRRRDRRRGISGRVHRVSTPLLT